MGSRVMGLIMGCLILVIILSKGGEAVTTYEVGGSLGWVVPPNTTYYKEWAADKTFVVGDSLSFNWTGTHDVAEASKTQYENCEKPSIKFSSSGVLELTKEGPLYFLCTIGDHCNSGQKLEINVSASNSTTPSTPSASPPPPPSASVSAHVYVNALFATTSMLFVYFMA
ncbi:umecyanin [Ziziphus jujuba]|uniref:Umecyanin n=2 Tax=Ziziphus jujuba TaxID=326968 RepID=A0ABM3IT92_ZIZJJ|nr:umecyanin [Ziziphus jujuba]KAH7546346.1 hypothetical protein FEM48_Zijuj01G0191000 [Ziziphus jujuba var. spinosa]